MKAAEYLRRDSGVNGVQYFRIGEIQPTQAEAERNRAAQGRTNTEILVAPEESLQKVLGEGDVHEIRGQAIPVAKTTTA
ncbi:MAG: hypothetical protein HY473_01710 [Candidatus Sungbacteria bacterium]|uniref:Uncharacterized protein n=1 Tax=Candidatus Sungiibacteriota bacterium TaxID=2750080 RepID=A0A932YYZ5_9BACT|nr:hypothetical protein [Candidatus Sungbacteria bacterium]